MGEAKREIQRLHAVCRAKDEGMCALICAIEDFLGGALRIERLQRVIEDSKEYVPVYRRTSTLHAGGAADSLPGPEPSPAPAPCTPMPMNARPSLQVRIEEMCSPQGYYMPAGWYDAIEVYSYGYILTQYTEFVPDDQVKEVRTL